MLQLKNITKKYVTGDLTVTALDDVSINFRKSEFVSILGPSGCGKTTMLNIIGGLDKYTSGDLVINGTTTKQFKDSDWDTYRNNRIGFVFQSYNLIPHQTIIANVELALTLSGVGSKERHARALQALEKVGLKREANKRPNQLSGGQMQRVAIARALVNDPEIILADEPTGALDTETSVQVMELLKEVANDRLVIMVTHNPELAMQYSTRIIRLLDGKTQADSNPYDGTSEEQPQDTLAQNVKGKAQMKLSTAFGLSLSNLRTKRARTALTSVAGSIGIIGIALVMAVSNGFQNYVYDLQSSTLSSYPVTVSESTIDLSDFDKLLTNANLDKFPTVKEVAQRKMFDTLTSMLKSNNISNDYMSYVNEFVNEQNANAGDYGTDWRYCVQKDYGLDINNYIFANIDMSGTKTIMPVDMLVRSLESSFSHLADSEIGITPQFVRGYIPTMCQLPNNQQLLDSQYDVLQGSWPTDKFQVVLVVDSYNRLSDITLALLGFNGIGNISNDTGDSVSVSFTKENATFTFDELLNNYKFYYVNNDDRYTQKTIPLGVDSKGNPLYYTGYVQNMYPNEQALPESAQPITISGIVRIKDGVQQGILDTGIAYTEEFVDYVLNDSLACDNCDVLSDGETIYNPLFATTQGYTGTQYSARELAVNNNIIKLSFYSVDYNAKETLKQHLDAWNDKPNIKNTENEVNYSDSMDMLFKTMNTIVDSVEIVLICFTSISLVVSSIMIGIITYVSVVERTKEIGVLRSLGARKKDISRIFNAETFLVGLFSGVIGVLVSYLLCIPINLIAGAQDAGLSSIATLNPLTALLLVAISFVLTLIAGLIPSRIAAKKDPVVALRTE